MISDDVIFLQVLRAYTHDFGHTTFKQLATALNSKCCLPAFANSATFACNTTSPMRS